MKLRAILCCLCVLMLALPGLAEGGNGPGAEETVIPPLYPVPDYVEWLLDTARNELGYTEDKGGVTKYGTWYGYATAEWCAEYLCWCVHQVDKAHGIRLLERTYPKYSGTNVGRDWFISQGRYVARRGVVPGWGTQWFKGETTPMAPNSYVPQPGDWAFFSNAATGDTAHVAMVEYCAYDEQGKIQLHVLEGNSPFSPVKDTVVRNVYPIDYWTIQGYGTVHDVADVAMRFGNKGAKVTALQENLAAAGIFPEGQRVTGQYGDITVRCIKAIQKQMGAPETGIADHATQLELQNMVYAMSADTPENWAVQE